MIIFSIVRKLLASVRRTCCTRLVKRRAKEYGTNLRVNYYSEVTGSTVLGNNVNFNGIKIMGSAKVQIGDYFHSGRGCQIITSFHDYDNDDYIPYGYNYISKDVVIGECVWLGNSVIVLAGVSIGEGAVIQAGSVVVSDIPPLAVAGGAPCKVFKWRNKEHYYKLKELGRFH